MFECGDELRYQATIKDYEGNLIDPTSQIVSFKMGDKVIDTGEPTRVSVGVYTYIYQSKITDSGGKWILEWKVVYGDATKYARYPILVRHTK